MAEGGVTEQVADVVETVGEEVEEMAEVIRSLNQVKIKYATLGATFGAAAGALIGFAVAYKKASVKYEKIAQDEIAQMREHYREKSVAAEQKPDLNEIVVELGYAAEREAMAEEQRPPIVEVKDKVVNVDKGLATTDAPGKNVFDEDQRGLTTDVWNYDQELANRSPDKPYILHKEEFAQGNFQGEDHEQATLTYYVQDDVLCDERDSQISNMDELVGLENLEKFGHGSEDANVVYIRNHKLKVDFEVLRSGGSYAAEVHGVEDGLQHSATRRRRPQRGYDDD